MNIDKAINHFKYKFQNTWKPTKTDIEAYNAIIDYKSMQEDVNLSQNESLAKLWIHQMMLLSNTKAYDGERSIQVIDEILKDSLYNWCLKLKDQIPMMRFNSVGLSKYPLPDDFNITKLQERNNKIIEEFEDELTEALKYKINEEQIIKFVKSQITRILHTYEK